MDVSNLTGKLFLGFSLPIRTGEKMSDLWLECGEPNKATCSYQPGSWPHVTLVSPRPMDFWTNETLELVREKVGAMPAPPRISLTRLEYFEPGHIVALPDDSTKQWVGDMHCELLNALGLLPGSEWEGERFHPHMTIASEASEDDLAYVALDLERVECPFPWSWEPQHLCLFHKGEKSHGYFNLTEFYFKGMVG